MIHRLGWLITSFLLPLLFLTAWVRSLNSTIATINPNTPKVIINEWSQGHGGSREWTELLVVDGPIDLRGWDLGDSTPGDLLFTNDPFWLDVPSGSLLLIYNGSDPDLHLPPNDENLGDCVAVISHDNNKLFSGRWPAFANTNPEDTPHLRNSTQETVHDFALVPGNIHPDANEGVAFVGDRTVDLPSFSKWNLLNAADTTPGQANGPENSRWMDNLCRGGNPTGPDLSLTKSGPQFAFPGEEIDYQLVLQNFGTTVAQNVIMTDSLPAGTTYGGDGSLPKPQQEDRLLIWELGDLHPDEVATISFTVMISDSLGGTITNTAVAGTTSPENNPANNISQLVTRIGVDRALVLIDAVLFDGFEYGDFDEAVRVRNIGDSVIDMSGWSISDGGVGKAFLPQGFLLQPKQATWLAWNKESFQRQFGFYPDLTLSPWPGFANTGDEVLLLDSNNEVIDALVYGSGMLESYWMGPPVVPYTRAGVFGAEGQILFRKRDPYSAEPMADSNQAVDWAQDVKDPLDGRKVYYPGWDLDEFFRPLKVTQAANILIAIAPDNALSALVNHIDTAEDSIQIEVHTLKSLDVADALIRAANRGLSVTALLEGSPVGGLPPQEKFICRQLEAAGGQCWFMIRDDSQRINDRYRYLHSKFLLFDRKIAAISSENLSYDSLPADNKEDGTWGRRGVIIFTDAPDVVTHLARVMERDFDPENHVDILRWRSEDPIYGDPPDGFIPVRESGGITYSVRYPHALSISGTYEFEVLQSPENSLRSDDGLLGLLQEAGDGDTVLVQQLEERLYWGSRNGTAENDPNLRLLFMIAAARRGASVHLLLDQYYDRGDDQLNNSATCEYVNLIAQKEHLNMSCALANPTGLGIHNKMVLAMINGRGYVHIGSLNGTELAAKGNREIAIQVQSNDVYEYLARMVIQDTPHTVYLPILTQAYQGPADHLLISEVLYDPQGPDDAEFIEIFNPTPNLIEISGFSISDALAMEDYEDLRRFPEGTSVSSGEIIVITTSATAFFNSYGYWPDFEILESVQSIPSLVDDATWGANEVFLRLGNQGDEVILRDRQDRIIDFLTYGLAKDEPDTPCPLAPGPGYSLERKDYWRSAKNCQLDFHYWPFPSPGRFPNVTGGF